MVTIKTIKRLVCDQNKLQLGDNVILQRAMKTLCAASFRLNLYSIHWQCTHRKYFAVFVTASKESL